MGLRDRIRAKNTAAPAAIQPRTVVVDLDEDEDDPVFEDVLPPASPFDRPVLHGLALPPPPMKDSQGRYFFPGPTRPQWLHIAEALAVRGVYEPGQIRDLTGLPLSVARSLMRSVTHRWATRGAIPVEDLRGILVGQAREVGRLAMELAQDQREGPRDRLTAMRTVLVAGERQSELLGAAAPKQVTHQHKGAVGLAVAVQARVDLSPEVLAEVGRAVSQVGIRVLAMDPIKQDPTPG